MGTRTPKVMPKNGHFGITHGDLGIPIGKPHQKQPPELPDRARLGAQTDK